MNLAVLVSHCAVNIVYKPSVKKRIPIKQALDLMALSLLVKRLKELPI